MDFLKHFLIGKKLYFCCQPQLIASTPCNAVMLPILGSKNISFDLSHSVPKSSSCSRNIQRKAGCFNRRIFLLKSNILSPLLKCSDLNETKIDFLASNVSLAVNNANWEFKELVLEGKHRANNLQALLATSSKNIAGKKKVLNQIFDLRNVKFQRF